MFVNCNECGKEVSDKAISCMGCGAPIGESVGSGTVLATTQATSKHLKTQILYALGAMVIGLFLLGIVGVIPGLVWFIATRLRIWWHHR